MRSLVLKGVEARAYVEDIGKLRIAVFREFPYLYDGDLEYEKKYLEIYFRSPSALIALIEDQGRIVGMTSAIALSDESPSFKAPFVASGQDIETIMYFGESILLSPLRSQGYGKWFMQVRLAHARAAGFKSVVFCRVVRDRDDPRRPLDYRPLDSFWLGLGFKPLELTTEYHWREIGEEEESAKTMQFWRLDL